MTIQDMWAILSKQRRANRVKHHPDDLALFDDHFIYLHECAHLVFLDWTPLKEIARVILSLCYDSIVQLMQSCSTSMSDEDAWEMFIENSRKLGLIEKSIKLPEELVATGFAIRAMEDQTLPGGMWTGYQEELEILKERVLAHEEKNFPANPKKKFPGFREYYKRTEPLIQLLSARPHLLACVIPLLQPVIGEEGERVKLYEANWYLDVFSFIYNRIIGHLENEEAAVRRLQLLNEGSEQLKKDREGWRIALGTLMEWAGEPVRMVGGIERYYGASAQLLWYISRGNIEWRSADSLDTNFLSHVDRTIEMLQGSLAKRSPSGTGNVAILQRRMYKTQSYIGIAHSGFQEGIISEEFRRKHLTLLLFEGIRQQLVVRKGFICPLMFGRQTCACVAQDRNGLRRLARLALDGFFGPGDWSLPPCLAQGRR